MSEDWKPEVVMAGLREKDYRAKRPEKVSQPTERRWAKQPRHQEQAGQRPEGRSMLATLKSEPPRSQCGGAEKAGQGASRVVPVQTPEATVRASAATLISQDVTNERQDH